MSEETTSNTKEIVYTIKDCKFEPVEITNPVKVDPHLHSLYSGINPDRFVGTPLTQKLCGVRESYLSPKRIYKILKKKRMGFYTISDHDSVTGSLELRKKHPDKTFINCEYTVNVRPRDNSQVIHALVWGLDYPENAIHPLSDTKVLEIHNELLEQSDAGYKRFVEYCKQMGIGVSLCHVAWQGVPENPFNGKQIDEITDAFPVLEINSDHRSENLFALEIALAKNKQICVGTDDHCGLRMGNQYTVSLHPVETPYEFLQAFKKGEIGIGSRRSIYNPLKKLTEKDIIEQQFNVTVISPVKDAYKGILEYLKHEWGNKKIINLGIFAGILFLASGLGKIPILAIIGTMAFAFSTIPRGMPIIEKVAVAQRTIKLYEDYNQHLFSRETKKLRSNILDLETEVRGLKKEEISILERYRSKKLLDPWPLRGLNRITFLLLSPFKFFHGDYDQGAIKRIKKDEKEDK